MRPGRLALSGLVLAMIMGAAPGARAQSLYELYDAARTFDAPRLNAASSSFRSELP